MMSARQIVSRLNDIASNSQDSKTLEQWLAQITMRDLWNYSFTETQSIERALGAAKKRISATKAAEKRLVKSA